MKLSTYRQSLARVGKTKHLGDTANETACYTLAYDRVDNLLIVRCVTDLVGPNQPQQVYALDITDEEFDQMAALVDAARAARPPAPDPRCPTCNSTDTRTGGGCNDYTFHTRRWDD